MVIAIVALAVSPTFAAKGKVQKSRISNLPQAQLAVDPVVANENHSYPAPDMRNKTVNKATALSGLYSIGTTAPGGYVANYTTLHAAVADLQTSGVSGPVTFEFTDAAYSDSGVTIGGYAGQGAANPVVFQPQAGNTPVLTFTGGSAANQWCVQFNGAQYVTWQGSPDPWVKGTPNRPMTMSCDTLTQAREVFRFSNGGTNLSLRHMRLHGWRRGTGTVGPRTNVNAFHGASASGWANSLFEDLLIDRAGFGINSGGPTAVITNSNTTIQGCTFGSVTGFKTDLLTTGLRMSNTVLTHIDNNDIGNTYTAGAAPEAFSTDGIDFSFGGMTGGTYITNNLIHNVTRQAGSGTAYGIRIHASAAPAASDNWRVFNNFIWDLHSNGIRAGNFQCVEGVNVQDVAATSGNSRFYNNTINIVHTQNAASPGHGSCLMASLVAGSNVRVANNVLSVQFTTPIYAPSNNGACVTDFNPLYLSDNNLYYYPLTDEAIFLISGATTLAGAYDAQYAGSDYASAVGNPGFYTPTNLHIDQTTVGFVSPANGLAFPYGPIPTDIDKEGRDLATPDAGADEFTPIPFPNEALPLGVGVPGVAGIPAGKSNIQPTASIRNNGSNTNDIPVRLVLNDGFFDVFNEVVTITGVPPLSNYDLTTELPMLPPLAVGNYTVTLSTELPTDDNPGNDVLNTTTSAVLKVVGTYATDFEGPNAAGWSHQSEGGGDSWVLGNPAKPLVTGAHSGVNAWVTNLTANYNNNDHAAVYSPYFDLTNVPFPIVKFWHTFSFEVDWDNGVVEYTLDNGGTWNSLGLIYDDPKGINWYTDGLNAHTDHYIVPGFVDSAASYYTGGPYFHSQYYSKDIGGQPQVRFRFRYFADGSVVMGGWSFDDFEINAAPSISGKVYNDVDNSGTFNVGDVAMAGAQVNLGGDATANTTTNGSGDYEFNNLIEGNYTVGTNVVFGTNVTPGGPGTYAPSLVKNVPVTADFGYYNPATATGNVWYDKNHNQIKDPSESGMSGIPVNASGAGVASANTNVNGDYSLTLNQAGAWTVTQGTLPSGYMQNFPKVGGYNVNVTYGDASGGNDFGNSSDLTDDLYRTAAYADWALAADYKNKQAAQKRKDWIVEMKFNIVAPRSGFTGFDLDFGMLTDGQVTEGKAKLVVVGTPFTQVKKVSFTGLSIDSSDTFQIDAIGYKGKMVKAKVKWTGRTVKPLTLKQTVADAEGYKANNPHPRMPNLNNVVVELYEQGAFPTGLLVGTPQGEKLGNSVIHPKYKDVYKSLSVFKTSTLHADSVRCLDIFPANGKPILKQQKSLPPTKYSNKLFAELLTAKLNVAASVYNKFPNGLGELVYLDKTQPGNPFNDQSINDIIVKADSMISCLDVTTKTTVPTVAELYGVLVQINTAFNGAVDSVSFAAKTVLTGVASLKSCTYLYANPSAIHASVVPGVVKDLTPVAYKLDQNYPNPFNPTTTIDFSLLQSGLVTLKVYNMLGQEVATLLDNVEFEDGDQTMDFDASNLSSGVYFYRLTVQPTADEDGVVGQAFTQVKKMLLVK